MRKSGKTSVDLRFVAGQAGVSVATASRALRQPHLVSDETRERILALVEEHGYVPDSQAAALSSRRTGLVGLVLPTLSNSIYAAFTEALQSELLSQGRRLIIVNTQYSEELERSVVLKLIESRVEGVVLTGARRDAAIYESLRRYDIPFVVTWTLSDDPTIPSIAFDNYGAARTALKLLIEHGHRQIGFMCGRTASNDRAAQRLRAYEDVLYENGLPFWSDRVAELSFEAEEGRATAEKWLRSRQPPTALFCANDILALGALFACQSLGLAVPDEVSIVGFDNLPITAVVPPGLTTIDVPAAEIGRRSAQFLFGPEWQQGSSTRIVMPTRLVARGSVGQARRVARGRTAGSSGRSGGG